MYLTVWATPPSLMNPMTLKITTGANKSLCEAKGRVIQS